MLFILACVSLLVLAILLFRQLKMTQKAIQGSDEWKQLYEQAHRERVAVLRQCKELERRNKALTLRLDTVEESAVPRRPEISEAEDPTAAEASKVQRASKPREPLRLILPIQLQSKNVRDRLHWRQQRKLKKEYLQIIQTKYRPPVTLKVKQRATVTRIKGSRERDFDEQNIGAGSAIELIDALTEAGYWLDDSPTWLETRFTQGSHKTVKGPAVIVEIEVLS